MKAKPYMIVGENKHETDYVFSDKEGVYRMSRVRQELIIANYPITIMICAKEYLKKSKKDANG